jgi:hypothetical protein
MSRIVFAAAMIASALAFAHHERTFERTGLLGSCSSLTAPAPDGVQWLECHPGRLTGYPDLSQDSCTRRGVRGEARYWICPTPLVAAHSPVEPATR